MNTWGVLLHVRRKIATTSVLIKQIERDVQNEERQIALSFIGQGERNSAPEYDEFNIQEISSHKMNPELIKFSKI